MSSIPRFFRTVAEFIANNYPEASKIVEIGVGMTPFTAIYLQELIKNLEIIVIDKDQNIISHLRDMGLKAVVDDVYNPRIEIYRNADLIYSIRPPFELFPFIEEIGELVKCDVLIVPLLEDVYLANISPKWRKIGLPAGTVCLHKTVQKT